MRPSGSAILPVESSNGVDGLARTIASAFPRARSDVRSALARTAAITRAEPGRTFVGQGVAGRIVLVTEGWVGMRRTTQDGRHLMPRIAKPGQVVTVLSLSGRATAGESIALTRAEVASWITDDVRSLAATDPGFGLDLVEQLADAYETVFVGLDGLLHQDAMQRVARVLLVNRELFFCEPPALSRSYLPAMVGTSREMTRRVLRRLESCGVVARSGRDGLVLLDAVGLERAGSTPH